MDLLQISRVINTELTEIGLYYRDILDQQEAVSIFNSVVACITDNWAEAFNFAVTDRHDPSQIFIRWEYELSDEQHFKRSGPPLQHILLSLKQIRQGTACLTCEVRWSNHFLSMDKVARERVIRDTYWGRKVDESQKKTIQTQVGNSSDEHKSQLVALTRPVDLEPLELDLMKMEEIGCIDKKKKAAIYESVKTCILAGYCRGIHFEMLDGERNRRILEWEFELGPDLRLKRTGNDQGQALALLKELGNHLPLDITPVLTQSFEGLTPKEKQEAMKNTIWANAFKRRWPFG